MSPLVFNPIGGFAVSGSQAARTAEAANVHVVDPLVDRRWDELVARHPKASPFHQRGWLQALQRTYGYQPFALTSAAPGEEMNDGIVFCRISSWITGTRAVSLPFADHCEPLVDGAADRARFSAWLQAERERQQWKYVELRPLMPLPEETSGLQPSRSYYFHELDLRPSLDHVFRRMHRDSIQRKIRRAEREGVAYEAGHSEELLEAFYQLLLLTRRRLRILPQPRNWFRNLAECMGDALEVRLARKNGTPIAAILTLRHRRTIVYKYGCSDERFHKLGGVPFLFWRLIEESKAGSAETVDFGRSDFESLGLVRFKDKFDTRKRILTYYRFPGSKKPMSNEWGPETGRLVSLLPDRAFCAAGRVLYRHIG